MPTNRRKRLKKAVHAPVCVCLDAADMQEWWLTDAGGKDLTDLPSFTTYSEATKFAAERNYVLLGMTDRAKDVVRRYIRSFENA